MSTFLERILETKRAEVRDLQSRAADLAVDTEALVTCRGFAAAIANSQSLAVVAEVKKASPSKGLIASDFNPVAIAATYERGGAVAVSVLTDVQYFQGHIDDLTEIHRHVSIPVLRKDFMIDELQIQEARIAGADAVLLIAAALPADRLRSLSKFAQSLGLDVLIEVHSVDELDAAMAASPSVLGVNNRDLHSFQVSLETTKTVIREVGQHQLVIAESGIHSAEDAVMMVRYGAQGILVGESLMRAGDPTQTIELLQSFQVARTTAPQAT